MNQFLPIENILYKTRLSKEEAIKRLSDNVEKQQSFGLAAHKHSYSKPYIGNVYGNSFEIKRAINYKNSFLPNIKGEIFSDYEGTKIRVTMKPESFVFVFMAIWFGGVAIGCVVTTFALFSQAFSPFFLIPYGMLVFGIVLLFGAFKTETKTSRTDLQRILEAEVE